MDFKEKPSNAWLAHSRKNNMPHCVSYEEMKQLESLLNERRMLSDEECDLLLAALQELRRARNKLAANKKIKVVKENKQVEGRCGNPSRFAHTCPFKEDINGDSDTLCHCCSACRHECAMDT